MRSTRLQLLVAFVAVVAAGAFFAARGLPPQACIGVATSIGDIRHALSWGVPIDSTEPRWGLTALHEAAYKDSEMAEFLINHGAAVTSQAHLNGMTPLHVASRAPTAEILIARGADVNARTTSREVPLHYAATDNHVGVARVLLDHDADPDAVGVCGWTPLHMATVRKNRAVVKLLLARGARSDVKDDTGRTPLEWAVFQGNSAIATILRDHDAKQ